MKIDGLADQFLGFIQSLGGDAETWEVGGVGTPPSLRLLVNDQIFHFKPACFRILFNVPGGMSSDGCPSTVTVPGLEDDENAGDCPWCEPTASRRFPSV